MALAMLALAAVAVAVMAGCSGGGTNEHEGRGSAAAGTTEPPRVLIVGIDGLDWPRVTRLADEGRMPNVARMREEGASGPLASIYPFVSPTVWTSIATGKVQEKHGVDGFVVNTKQAGAEGNLTTSNMRKARAIWQILSAAERSVGVIGWLVTYPADVVNGYLVSSHVTIALSGKRSSRAPNQTDEWLGEGIYPPEIWTEVADNVFNEEDVSDSVIDYFVETSAERARQEEKIRSESLAKFYASDVTSLTLARHFFDTMPADFSAVYFRGCDMASHFFWRFMEPESWSRELSPGSVETFAPVVDRYYAVADSLLGEMLELADENTVVMLISDHGFAGHRGYAGFEGDVAVGVEMHRKEGVIFVTGPGIETGRAIEGAGVLDIAPTVLALSGLPVARDMDGRPLTEVMSASFLEEYPVVYIDTYEVGGGDGDDTEPVESPVDDEIKEMLRSLGYIN